MSITSFHFTESIPREASLNIHSCLPELLVMQEPFLAEIKFIPARVEPEGWAWCDGRKMLIAEHSALFELLGTTFGGDGQSTFALPNLIGRKPVPIELHSVNLSLANQSSSPFGLERSAPLHHAVQTYELTYFCIALKGAFPVSSIDH